jgi:hypothetical protein
MDFEPIRSSRRSTTSREENTRKSANVRYAELIPAATSCRRCRPPCGQRLSSHWLFLIIKRKKSP